MNYPPNGAVVTSQPTQYDIHSNFAMFPGERLLYHCRFNSGCCDLGDDYYISLSDTRFVARKEICVCCGCCFKRPFIDRSIYLHDIAQLEERYDGTVCCECCGNGICKFCCCCCATYKRLRLHGSFGTHLILMDTRDLPDFQFLITSAIAQHKLPRRY